jgi:exopolysaccharide biosynthesis polyprenyl glycosylphosphotransferase
MSRPSPARELARGVDEANLARLWRYRNLVLLSLDVTVICCAFLLSYYLRFYLKFLAIQEMPVPDIQPYFGAATLLSALWVAFSWRGGGYDSGLLREGVPLENIQSLIVAGVYSTIGLMVTSFMVRGLLLSRQVYIMTFIFSSAGMIGARLFLRMSESFVRRRGIHHRVMVVGTDDQARDFARLISDHANVHIIGHLSWSRGQFSSEKVESIGSLDEVEQIFGRYKFDTLVLSLSDRQASTDHAKERVFETLNFCEVHSVSLYVINNSFDVAVAPREVGSIHGIPLMQLQDASLHRGYAVVKRALDIVLSLMALIIGTPIWFLVALLIKLDSKGPVLFRQMRAGLHGRPFVLYKFRSMTENAEAELGELIDVNALDEPVFKIKSDPRVTRIGKFLRQTGLDEVPQIINVLKGEMSLVGPRPEEISMVGRYNAWQKRRLKAKPGITGYQQVNNRGEPSLSRRVRYDLVYLKQQSLILDLYIMAKTLIVVTRGTGITH